MKQGEATIPAIARCFLTEARERLVQLYEAGAPLRLHKGTGPPRGRVPLGSSQSPAGHRLPNAKIGRGTLALLPSKAPAPESLA